MSHALTGSEARTALILVCTLSVVNFLYLRIQKKNKHQKTYWSITKISAGLHTVTSTPRVGKHDKSEQGSLPGHLSHGHGHAPGHGNSIVENEVRRLTIM